MLYANLGEPVINIAYVIVIFLNMSVFFVQIILIAMMVVTEAYKSKRDISFFNEDIMSYRKPRLRNFFFDQSFIDKMAEQQTPHTRVTRDQTINPQTLHNLFLKDHITSPPEFTIFRHQPFRQNSFSVPLFKDKLLLRDAVIKNQELQGEREVFRDNPFIGQSLISGEIFQRQVPTYKMQTPFKEQLLTTEKPFKNLHYKQLPLSEQTSSQKQTTFVEFPPISNSIKFDQDESYNKLNDLYKQNKDIQTLSNKGFSITKYGMYILHTHIYIYPYTILVLKFFK